MSLTIIRVSIGNDLVVVEPAVLRGGGALLALERVLVLVLAADLVAVGDDVGGLDHRHPQARILLAAIRGLSTWSVKPLPVRLWVIDSTPAPTTIGLAVDDDPAGGGGDRVQSRTSSGG